MPKWTLEVDQVTPGEMTLRLVGDETGRTLASLGPDGRPVPLTEDRWVPAGDGLRVRVVAQPGPAFGEFGTNDVPAGRFTAELQVMVPGRAPARHPLEPRTDRTEVIGRSSGCTFVVDHASVSGKHVKIWFDGRSFVAGNLSRTNPAKLGGQPLVGSQPLRHGDEVTMGRVVLKLFDVQGALGLVSVVPTDGPAVPEPAAAAVAALPGRPAPPRATSDSARTDARASRSRWSPAFVAGIVVAVLVAVALAYVFAKVAYWFATN